MCTSRLLHTVAHLVDGFIGVDSRFYNLEEDSHRVSKALRQRIEIAPEQFWIIRARGESDSGRVNQLRFLRDPARQGDGDTGSTPQ